MWGLGSVLQERPRDHGLPIPRGGFKARVAFMDRSEEAFDDVSFPPGRGDPARLAELKRLCVLDSSPERAYDDITRLLATELAVPITMVNLLDEERDWFKSCFGVQQTQSPAVTLFLRDVLHIAQ